MKKQLVRKAVVYCMQRGRLLVFKQPEYPLEETGIQVPAGTVHDGELPVDAARRELAEETGRTEIEIVRFLGQDVFDLWPYRNEIHERHFFEAAPTTPLPDAWIGGEEHDGAALPTRFEFFWIPLDRAHVLVAGQSAMIWALSLPRTDQIAQHTDRTTH